MLGCHPEKSAKNLELRCVASYAESFHLAQWCAMGNFLCSLKSKLPDKVPGRV